MSMNELPAQVSNGCLIGANVAFLLAFTSNSWMRYIVTEQEIDDYVPKYGLWETCLCRQVYTIFKDPPRPDSSSSSTEDFPGWFTASQLFATFGLVCMWSALCLAALHVLGMFVSRFAHVVLLCLLSATGLFVLLAVSLFGGRFGEEDIFKLDSEEEDDVDIMTDWGLNCTVIAWICTVIAGVLALVLVVRGATPGTSGASQPPNNGPS